MDLSSSKFGKTISAKYNVTAKLPERLSNILFSDGVSFPSNYPQQLDSQVTTSSFVQLMDPGPKTRDKIG